MFEKERMNNYECTENEYRVALDKNVEGKSPLMHIRQWPHDCSQDAPQQSYYNISTYDANTWNS